MSDQREKCILTFHGLGLPKRSVESDELPYWLPVDLYFEIIEAVITSYPFIDLVVTFDDGNDSDLLHGVPILLDRNVRTEVFVISSRIDKVGYLTREDIVNLARLNVAIGSHGIDHVRWDLCDADALREEIVGSAARLGEIVGRTIRSASLPFGRYNGRVLKALRDGGIDRVYSSDGGPRFTQFLPTPRFTIKRDMTPEFVVQKIKRALSLQSKLMTEIRCLIKSARR